MSDEKQKCETVVLLDVAFEFEPGFYTLDEIMHRLHCLDGTLKAKANGWTMSEPKVDK